MHVRCFNWNHDRVPPLAELVLVTVYDFQGGGFFMCIMHGIMRFATRSVLLKL